MEKINTYFSTSFSACGGICNHFLASRCINLSVSSSKQLDDFPKCYLNEILSSSKTTFRIIIIIVVTFFTFVNWFCQYVITVVMIQKFFCNQSRCTSLHRTSFLSSGNFWIIFSDVSVPHTVLCSSFENHAQLLSCRCDKYLS